MAEDATSRLLRQVTASPAPAPPPLRRRAALSARQVAALVLAGAAGIAGALVSPALGVLAAAFLGAATGGLFSGLVAVVLAATGAPVLHAITHSLVAPSEWVTGLVALGAGMYLRVRVGSGRNRTRRRPKS